MRIPHTKLVLATLRALSKSSSLGTEYSAVEQRVENVLEQLKVGRVELHFDDQTETCNIVTAKNGEIPPTDALR